MNTTAARAPAVALPGSKTRVAAFAGLMKLRLNLMVLVAVGTAYVLAGPESPTLLSVTALLLGILGTGGGASAMNMALEADLDRRMNRTKGRPVPAGLVTEREAMLFGSFIASAGMVIIALGCDVLAALLAGLTVILYVCVYTPLKTKTTLNTLVGAVPGALPALIGWAAARGDLDVAALSLFGIVFFWQFPHFLAIASMYREDYRDGGFRMLPVADPEGTRTAHQTVLYALLLVPVSLLPAWLAMAGNAYLVGALLLSLTYLAFSVRAAWLRTRAAWRTLLRVSLMILPGLFALMIADRMPL